MTSSSECVDVVVIGGGPGGYAAAFRAADLGKQVTIVDPEPILGGSCLIRGCIPSKALIAAAELAEQMRDASAIGIETGPITVHMDRLSKWREKIIGQIGKGLNELAKRRNVQCIRGRARFADTQHVIVQSDGSSDRTLQFGHAVIASGARPAFPPGLEPDGSLVLSSTEALELAQVPQRLLVVGGGYIGLELGTCFLLLGSQITIVEMTAGLLPGTDPELVRPVLRKLESRAARVLLQTQVVSLERVANEVHVAMQRSGSTSTEVFDRVLVCVGRMPNTDGLALDRAGVTTDPRGTIECDDQGRTSQPTIFAVGDCSPGPLLAHKARRDGLVAAETICGVPARRDQKTIPAVIFCDPEIATCGLSEPKAIAAGRNIQIGRFPFAALGRAVTQHAAEGMVKLIADPDTERVLGVGIVGPCASELIAEATLAVELGASVANLMHTIHAHPTLSEALPEAAELVRGASIHIYKKRR